MWQACHGYTLLSSGALINNTTRAESQRQNPGAGRRVNFSTLNQSGGCLRSRADLEAARIFGRFAEMFQE